MAGGFTHEASKGASVEWYSPPSIFEALGLTFDLDPCHPEGEPLPWVPAAKVYTRQDDGLTQPWEGRVYCNPPYGPKDNDAWLGRMAHHGNGIALVFARMDTGWFHRHGATADAVCFLSRRVRFVDRTGKPPIKDNGKPADSPGTGSMLLAWGADCVEALHRSGLGVVFIPSMKEAASA